QAHGQRPGMHDVERSAAGRRELAPELDGPGADRRGRRGGHDGAEVRAAFGAHDPNRAWTLAQELARHPPHRRAARLLVVPAHDHEIALAALDRPDELEPAEVAS